MDALDKYCDSPLWYSNETWDRQEDLTWCFKNTVLVWVPCIYFISFLPLQLYFIWSSRCRDVPITFSNFSKMFFIAFIAVVHFKHIIDHTCLGREQSYVRLHASILNFFVYVLFLLLTWANLKKGIRFSGILWSFSVISVLCGLPQFLDMFRSTQSNDPRNGLGWFSFALIYVSTILIFVLNCVRDPEPTYSLSVISKNACPSKKASFLSKMTLNWFSQYVWKNYRTPVDDHLWELDEKDSSKFLSDKYKKIWGGDDSGKPKRSIVILLVKAFGLPFAYILFLRSFDTIFTLSYPLIFRFLISAIKRDRPLWILNTCAFGFFVCNTINALIMGVLFNRLGKLTIRVRSTLMSIVYEKVLRITDQVRNNYTSGEIVTLITADIDKVVVSLNYLPYFWIVPFHFILSFYFIWDMFGSSAMICIVIMMALLSVNFYLTSAIEKLTRVNAVHQGTRGKFVQDLLAGIKALKMYAWESCFIRKAAALRHEEYKGLKKAGFRYALIIFIFDAIPPVMSSLSFAAYMYFTKQVLNVELAFVTVSVFNTFKTPLRLLSNYLTNIVEAYVSMKRIDTFLNLPELNTNCIHHKKTDEALIIENGSFSWTNSDQTPVLKDINIKIPQGKLVSVVGSVGSGKTSLISAFLGELNQIKGYTNVNGKIAYVPQQAWIRNATFKDNVTLGEYLDPQVYENVLFCCALNEDLNTFAGGDLSEIGEKGINLSGGQKQRVNLARAICCNADIYFFDDSLSAVDFRVSKHIFDNVIGPGGILKDKTRILVTHSMSFLPQSDLIIMVHDGRVLECGTFEEMKQNGGFSAFLSGYLNNCNQNEEQETISRNEDYVNNRNDKTIEQTDNSTLRNRRNSKTMNSVSSGDLKLIEKEHIEIGTIKKEVYKFFLSQLGIVIAVRILLLNICFQIISMSSRIWLTIWSSMDQRNSQDLQQIFHFFIYAGFGIMEALTSLVANVTLFNGIFRASTQIYNKLITCVLHWPLWLLEITPVGRIINRATFDIEILDEKMSKKSVGFLEIGNRFLVIILVTCFLVPSSVLVFVPVLIVIFILQRFYGALAHQLERINANNRTPFSSYVIDTVAGLHIIRANGYRDRFVAWLYEKIDLYSSESYAYAVNHRWFSMRIQILCGVTVSALIMLALMKKDYLSLGLLCFLISYAIQWTIEFAWFLIYAQELEASIIAVERIKEYIDQPQEVSGNILTSEELLNWPQHGEIRFVKYELRYRKNDNLVLKGITFSIKQGEKVGVVGRTGAGKSSLILALLRMVEPSGGSIFIDDVDISKIDLNFLRSRLTLIPQDPVLFLGTVRFNLDPYGKYSDESIWDALEKSHLRKFIQQSPCGLEFPIEEDGKNISCGQKQLLCIARALLRKSNILLLDEATASVDLEVDELIQNTIRREFSECTVLTVAHRLITIQDYDKIMVLDEGSVVEFDSPGNLINSKSSLFCDMMQKAGLVRE